MPPWLTFLLAFCIIVLLGKIMINLGDIIDLLRLRKPPE
jgi:hypothetical protein